MTLIPKSPPFLVLHQQRCVFFPILEAVAKGYSKPKTAAAPAPVALPEPQAEPMAASPSPVASPVAAPAPGTVEVKEEAKPEDPRIGLERNANFQKKIPFGIWIFWYVGIILGVDKD